MVHCQCPAGGPGPSPVRYSAAIGGPQTAGPGGAPAAFLRHCQSRWQVCLYTLSEAPGPPASPAALRPRPLSRVNTEGGSAGPAVRGLTEAVGRTCQCLCQTRRLVHGRRPAWAALVPTRTQTLARCHTVEFTNNGCCAHWHCTKDGSAAPQCAELRVAAAAPGALSSPPLRASLRHGH